MGVTDPRIGITTTVPVEVLLAAGRIPVDLNNLFIAHPHRDGLVARAEREGFSRSVCGWIKGIFGATVTDGIGTVVAVTTGDCSNTLALAEVLEDRGVSVIRFAYPENPSPREAARAIDRFAGALDVSVEDSEKWRVRLAGIRKDLCELDRLTWSEGIVTGGENHEFLVSSSDLNGDPDAFGARLGAFLNKARNRTPEPGSVRLGVMGVPPIFDDFHAFLEGKGARVVLNEVQRQFSMPYECESLAQQYSRYTYPYGILGRLADVNREIECRGIQGIVHYVQAFCHRQIEDILVKEKLPVPVLTLEGDQAGPLDGRSHVRLEAFIEMLQRTSHAG